MNRPNDGTLCDFLAAGLYEKVAAGNVIAAGPLAKQPATMSYRVVLVQGTERGDFVVYNQYFNDIPLGPLDRDMHNWLGDGDYFTSDKLVEATKKFASRVSRQAEYLETLYRGQ